jgi:hypothetical protein
VSEREEIGQPMTVALADIDLQRERGWTEFHPEDYCHRCGQRNVQAWFADAATWRPTMQVPKEQWNGIVCPQCFTELYAAAFPVPPPIWRLVLFQGAHQEVVSISEDVQLIRLLLGPGASEFRDALDRIERSLARHTGAPPSKPKVGPPPTKPVGSITEQEGS